MDLNKQQFIDTIRIGRVLLTEAILPHLEAFSGNALYCGRGMPTMNRYKTVKEVCDLTGLTRKHLYYFHHEKVVQAVAYANYSVYGYDGYKLYDDAAVEKLQQIALYYQLGLKRDEIRDIMLDPKYDSNLVLETLLAIEQTKKATIERHIAALEYLKLSGTKNRLLSPLRGISLEELGQTILNIQDTAKTDCLIAMLNGTQTEAFSTEFLKLLRELQELDQASLNGQQGTQIIKKIFELGATYMGEDGCPFILGLFLSAIGDGTALYELHSTVSPAHSEAVIQYLLQHPELYTNSFHGNIPESLRKDRRTKK